MSTYTTLRSLFRVSWTTILVGWKGIGVFSPWPDRWAEFPSLLSIDEVLDYANERLVSSRDVTEEELLIDLVSLDRHTACREGVADYITKLANMNGGDQVLEGRKWRVVLLDGVLRDLPSDSLYGLIALSEFWQGFGFPPDSPHEIQGRENKQIPEDYYDDSNYRRLVESHQTWIEKEKAELGAR